MSSSESWSDFLKRNKGKGYSRSKLSQLYQAQKGESGVKKSPVKKTTTKAKKTEENSEIHSVTVVSIYKDMEPDFDVYLFHTRAKAESHYKNLTGSYPTRPRQAGKVEDYRVNRGSVAWALISESEVY